MRPKKKNSFVAENRLESIGYGLSGFRDMFLTEPNAWIHAVATMTVLGVSLWLNIGRIRCAIIIISIVIVWVAEAFNTVLEIMADLIVTPERYSRIVRRAKDIAASGVLAASVGALAIGILILGPPFYQKLAVYWPK